MQNKAFYVFKKSVFEFVTSGFTCRFFSNAAVLKHSLGLILFLWVLVSLFMSACALSSSFCVMAALQQAADWNLLFCEMRWFEERPPQASRGLFLLSVLSCALLSECTAYCTQTLKSLCSLSPPCLYLSLPFSFLFPSFLSALGCFWCICVLWMLFFNACFPMPLFSLCKTVSLFPFKQRR